MDYAGFDCKITVPLQSPIRRRRWRIVGNSVQAKAKPEAQLGDSETESKEPRRVGCGNPHKSLIHPLYNRL